MQVEVRRNHNGAWCIVGDGWTMHPIGLVSREQARKICEIAAAALMLHFMVQQDSSSTEQLSIDFNRAVVARYGNMVPAEEVVLAAATILQAYLTALPMSRLNALRDQTISILRTVAPDDTSHATQQDLGILAQVRHDAAQLIKIDWLSEDEVGILQRLFEAVLPSFHLALNAERRAKSSASAVRAASVQVLQNLLVAVVRNTTDPKDRLQTFLHLAGLISMDVNAQDLGAA